MVAQIRAAGEKLLAFQRTCYLAKMPPPPKSYVSSELRWLIRQARPMQFLLGVDLLCILAGSTLSLLDPLVLKWLIDVALKEHQLRLVLLGTMVFCAVYLAGVGMNYLSSFVCWVVTQKMVFRIRIALLRKLNALPLDASGGFPIGETLFRMEQDVDRVAELSGDILPLTAQMTMMGLMVLVTMGALNWRLTALVAPVLPLFYGAQRHYSAKLRHAGEETQRQSGKMSAFLQEHLAGIVQLHLLNRTGSQTKQFARIAARSSQLQTMQRATEMAFGGASVTVIVLGMGLILTYGGYEVTRGLLTVGGLVAFYGYVFRLFAPVSVAIDLQARVQRVGASIRRVLEIAERPDPVMQEESGVRTTGDSSPAALEFRSVSFAYSKRPALREATFRVERGETVALVGLNGSGKSTIGLLATGLYDPAAGTILVGGYDIRAMAKRSLRSHITLLPQEPILFDRTIRDNLLFGNPGASPADLDMVAALTQFDCVLRRLPCGLDEPLGPVGAKLSGGERKRLALARTLLQDPKILIVDEFTNSLDVPSAALILAGLDQFRRGRTLVVISHRPSAILWADRIVVLDEGRIVDTGQHADLIGRCEAYQRIWEFQENPIANSEWIASRKTPSNGEVRTGFIKESMHWQ